MDRWVKAAQWLVAGIIVATTVVAFAQSYRGLVDWSLRHQVPPQWAWSWPLMVDSFLMVGELRLFIAAARGAPWRVRLWAWCVTLGGLAISVAGNVGHLAVADTLDRATAAVPPLAAAVALGLGLGLVKALPPVAAQRPARVNRVAAPNRLLRACMWVRTLRVPPPRLGRHKQPERPEPQAGPPPADPPPPSGESDGAPAPGAPGPWDEQLAAAIAFDLRCGLNMARRPVSQRHGITEHQAMKYVTAARKAAAGRQLQEV